VQFAGRPLETDVSPGAWLADALDGRPGGTLGGLVPPTFTAFARVLHPAVRYDGDDDVEVPWAAVAGFNGTAVHPLAQWPSLTGAWDYVSADSQPPIWDQPPAEGHLPAATAERMIAVLRGHTDAAGDCWFGVWHGWGSIRASGPTLVLPGREHWLLRGPIELAAQNMAEEPAEQGVSLWWPADRAWCVATDIDLMSTYVGGSRTCVDELLAADGLEVLPATPDDRAGFDSDTVNPPPES
jgi:hypothetical protein